MTTETPITDAAIAATERDRDWHHLSRSCVKLERDRAALIAALESAAASIEQLVTIGRIPANNKGLRDARATLAAVQS